MAGGAGSYLEIVFHFAVYCSIFQCVGATVFTMGWLQLEGSIKYYVSFAKKPYKRDDILQKRPIILSILLTEATP